MLYDPRYSQLAVYALYAIPAHLLISFLPHEPALWIAARLYPALLVAVVGTVATLVAIVIDYWLIGWLVNHHLVKPVVQGSRWFKFAERWFEQGAGAADCRLGPRAGALLSGQDHGDRRRLSAAALRAGADRRAAAALLLAGARALGS